MSSLKRLLRALVLSPLLLLILPGPREASAIEVDPYLYRSLIATITFEYQTTHTKPEKGLERTSSYFRQTYSLDSQGNIYSRRLLIYDAGISLIDYDYTSDGSDSTSERFNYYLSTTLLSKSTIPLTLYGSRTTATLTVAPSTSPPDETTTTTYGFSWSLKMRRPPTTTVSAERSETTGRTVDTASQNYRVQMTKEIGPTDNSFNYSNNENKNNRTDTKSSRSTMNFSNRAKLSKSTRTTLGITRSESQTGGGTTSTMEAASMSLTSKPSAEFDQSHNFTAFKNETDGTQEGRSYSGDLNYIFSPRLNTHMDLSVDTAENDTPTTKSTNDTLTTSASATYRVWTNLLVAESVSYYRFKSSAATDPTNETLSERTLFKATTRVNYSKHLDWASLSAQYSFAYTDDKLSDETKGKGIEQSITVSLSDIDFNRYANFNASASQSYTIPLSGDISGSAYSYSTSVYNKVWRKYVNMGAFYQKDAESSWISILENKSESYGFNASSDYFRNTKFGLTTEHTNKFTNLIGVSNTNTTMVTASHNRAIYGGAFTGVLSYNFVDSDFPGRSQRIKTALISANYQRRLTRRIFWAARVQRTESNTNGVFDSLTEIENKLGYSLRAWFFALEHTYKIFNKTSDSYTENIVYMMATRSFFRRF